MKKKGKVKVIDRRNKLPDKTLMPVIFSSGNVTTYHHSLF